MVIAIHMPPLLRLVAITPTLFGLLVDVHAMPFQHHIPVARREGVAVQVSPQGKIARSQDLQDPTAAEATSNDATNNTYTVSISGGSACVGLDGSYTYNASNNKYAAESAIFACEGNADPMMCYLVKADAGAERMFDVYCGGTCGINPPTTGWSPVFSGCTGATLTLMVSDAAPLEVTTPTPTPLVTPLEVTSPTPESSVTAAPATTTTAASPTDAKNNVYAVSVLGGTSCTGIDGSFTFNAKYDKYTNADAFFFSCKGNADPNMCYLVRVDGMQQVFQANCGAPCGTPPTSAWAPVESGCAGATLTVVLSEAALTTLEAATPAPAATTTVVVPPDVAPTTTAVGAVVPAPTVESTTPPPVLPIAPSTSPATAYHVSISGGSSCTGVDGPYGFTPTGNRYANGDVAFFACMGNPDASMCYLVRADGMHQLFQASCEGLCTIEPPTTGWEAVDSGCEGATVTLEQPGTWSEDVKSGANVGYPGFVAALSGLVVLAK